MKKILVTSLQLAVTVFALWWIFRKPGTFTGMVNAVRQAELIWLLFALLAGAISPVAATLRWWILLRVQSVFLPLKRVSEFYMVGAFFNLFLLGSTGGDAVKAFYVLRESPPERRAGAILAVIMDRLLGLLALILLAAVFISLRYSWLTRTPEAAQLVHAFMFVLGGALGGLVILFFTAQFNLVNHLPAGFPARAKFLELAAAIQTYTRAWPTTLGCIFISLVGHSSFFITYYCAARALRAAVSFLDMTVVIPIVNTFVALPISMSGVGMRETLMVRFLGDLCHVPQEQAVPISIIGFLCTVIFYGLLGGLVYLFFRSEVGAVPAHVEDVEEKMEAAELPAIERELRRPRGTTDA